MDLRTQIRKKDVVTFANGNRAEVGLNTMCILMTYYDEDLNCSSKPEYSIVKVERPYYQTVFDLKIQDEVHIKKNVR